MISNRGEVSLFRNITLALLTWLTVGLSAGPCGPSGNVYRPGKTPEMWL